MIMANYVEIKTGRYPVSQSQIRSENPQTSYPASFPVPDGFALVFPAPAPNVDPITQIAREIAPELTGLGHWEQRWEVVDKYADYTDENDVLHTKAEQEAAAALAAFKATVPTSVTMRQARLALLGANVLASVDAAIASMEGVEGDAARIEWEYAHEIRRDSPLVTAMSGLLNLDETALDQLFITASGL